MTAPNKTLENGQWGRVAADTGVSLPDPIAANPNEGLAPLVDDNGRQIVRIAEEGGYVNPGTLTRFTEAGARTPVVGVVVEANPLLQLDGLWGYNGNLTPTLFFLHIYNLAVLPTAAVSIPDYVIPVPGNFNTFSFGERIALSTGYTIAASSTEFVFTALAATDLWFATNYYV